MNDGNRKRRFAAPRQLHGKLVLALLAFALTLGALEGALRVYEWANRDQGVVAREYASAPRVDPDALLDELSDGKTITADTFNIYYFGGSTMAGSTFVSLIDRMLGSRVGDKPTRSIIVAADGMDLHFNLLRLEAILAERQSFHPDLCVVYSGHNQFLRFHSPAEGVPFGRAYPGVFGRLARHSHLVRAIMDRSNIYRLEIDERTFFDEPLLAGDGYAEVVEAYRDQLRIFSDRLAEHRIPLVISTVVGNYSDWDPNRSLFCGADREKDGFRELMDEGSRYEARGEFEDAAATYRKALEICPTFAETHYRLGVALRELHRYDEAWTAFVEAVAHDGMPVRAVPLQNDFILELGASGRAHVVDAVAALRAAAPDGLIGFNLMADGHHPNVEGYGILAELISRKIAEALSLPGEQLVRIDRAELEALYGWNQSAKAFRMHVGWGRWYARLATWRYDPRARLDRAEMHFTRALSMRSTDYRPHLGLALVHYLRRDPETADEYLKQAGERDRKAVREYLRLPWIAAVVQRAHGE